MGDVLVRDNAFEKWPKKDQERFITKFCDSYNFEKRTDYRMTPESLKDAQDYDFTLVSGNNKSLKVQHTFAAADPESEYVGPKLQYAVITKLRNDLKQLKNIHIILGFKKIQNKSKASTLADEIKRIVNDTVGQNGETPTNELTPLFHYRWTDESKPVVTEMIKELLTSLDIIYSRSDQITFGYVGPVNSVMADDVRADEAINKKKKHYSDPHDVILIVHYNSPFFGDFFEPVIKEKHSKSSFGGVWLFDAWKDRFIFIK
ncbi:MAG: hypothetical protein M1320_00205 [Patescibacteria group bacterium]|nr:hypothetical protein [Patescibacteria group bacterium]